VEADERDVLQQHPVQLHLRDASAREADHQEPPVPGDALERGVEHVAPDRIVDDVRAVAVGRGAHRVDPVGSTVADGHLTPRRAPRAGAPARSAKAPSGTEARMRSPAAKPSTPRPAARTTPASSAPGMNGKGGFTWYCPRTMRRSKKLQPAARTSTASVPGA